MQPQHPPQQTPLPSQSGPPDEAWQENLARQKLKAKEILRAQHAWALTIFQEHVEQSKLKGPTTVQPADGQQNRRGEHPSELTAEASNATSSSSTPARPGAEKQTRWWSQDAPPPPSSPEPCAWELSPVPPRPPPRRKDLGSHELQVLSGFSGELLCEVSLPSNSTLSELKTEIEKLTGILAAEQKLVAGTRTLHLLSSLDGINCVQLVRLAPRQCFDAAEAREWMRNRHKAVLEQYEHQKQSGQTEILYLSDVAAAPGAVQGPMPTPEEAAAREEREQEVKRKVQLLPPWRRIKDTKTGWFFYQNTTTKETQWMYPFLPAHYKAYVQDDTRRFYYYNCVTKTVSWDPPEGEEYTEQVPFSRLAPVVTDAQVAIEEGQGGASTSEDLREVETSAAQTSARSLATSSTGQAAAGQTMVQKPGMAQGATEVPCDSPAAENLAKPAAKEKVVSHVAVGPASASSSSSSQGPHRCPADSEASRDSRAPTGDAKAELAYLRSRVADLEGQCASFRDATRQAEDRLALKTQQVLDLQVRFDELQQRYTEATLDAERRRVDEATPPAGAASPMPGPAAPAAAAARQSNPPTLHRSGRGRRGARRRHRRPSLPDPGREGQTLGGP